MIDPRKVFSPEGYGPNWGLYRFPRDKQVELVRLHQSGDWQTIRPAKSEEIELLEEHEEK